MPVRKRVRYYLIALLLITAQKAHATENVPGVATPPPEVLKLLQDLNRQYGPDTVTLVTWLLDAAVRSGSVLPASVRVSGYETREGIKFLAFRVETGLIFNTRVLDQTQRLAVLWGKVLEKAFAPLDTLRVPADGVMIELIYHYKSYADTDELSEHVDEPGTLEGAKFYFRGDPLRAFLNEELSPQTLLTHTQVLVNGTPVNFALPGQGLRTGPLDRRRVAERR
jgi:hypothetical protein